MVAIIGGSADLRSSPTRVSFAQLRTASAVDATALHGLWTLYGMLRRPEDVYTDPAVVAHTLAVLGDPDLPRANQSPSRERLLAALAVSRLRSRVMEPQRKPRHDLCIRRTCRGTLVVSCDFSLLRTRDDDADAHRLRSRPFPRPPT